MNLQTNAALPRFASHRFVPYAALLAAILTFCLGTSFAKSLFPLVGAEGTTAYRVGLRPSSCSRSCDRGGNP